MSGFAVSITSMGIVSALGRGVDETVARIRDGRVGLGPLTSFVTPLGSRIAVSQVPHDIPSTMQRCDELALDAARQAFVQAGLGARDLADCALVMGSISGDSFESEKRYRRELTQVGRTSCVTVEPGPGHMALRIADKLGIGGPVWTIGSACTSSANGVLFARNLLRTGRVRRALVIGADILSATLVHGFEALILLDHDGCRPFDRDRKGIQLGEAAGAILLEPTEHAELDAPRILGGAARCDPTHMTAGSPDGSAGETVMRAGLMNAGVTVRDLTAIKAHGTGTPDNDLTEGRALRRTFADAMPPFSSIKRFLGHTMGATGVTEIVAYLGCIKDGFIPANAGFDTVDPEIGLTPLLKTIAAPANGTYLLNYFGFGGNSVSLVAQMGGDTGTAGVRS